MPVDIQSNCPNCKPQDAIVFPWFAELLGCCVLFVLTRYQIPVPFAAMMFIVGACIGAGSVLIDQDNVLQRSIAIWTSIDSQLLLLVFLPPLIFKDAVLIPVHLFLVSTIQIWILAFPMVLLGTGLTGIVLYYIFPYDLNMWACLTLGAILASTDPIAVSSVLKTAGASPRLVMHISGESLLNDGSSFVFFTIFSRLLYISMGIQDDPEDKEVTVFEGFVLFFRMSLGGTVVGAAFGGALLLVLWELDRRLEREFDVLQVVAGLSTAYLCFYVCDQLLNMSGVVAVVVCGVIVNYFGRGLINDEELMESFLVLAEHLLNTLLFTLGGVIWGAISFESTESYQVSLRDWVWLIVLYFFVMLIRVFQIGLFYPILSRIGLKSNKREAAFLAYAGLRGAVGVALGLTVVRYVLTNTEDKELRKLTTILQFMGGGVTLFTLTINGTTAAPVLKLLGLAKPKVTPEKIKLIFEGAAKDFVYEQIAQFYEEKRFHHVQFKILKEMVPFVTTEPPRLHQYDEEMVTSQVQTPMKEFSSRISRGGDQYLQVLDLSRRVISSVPGGQAEENTRDELLVAMRQIFLELLNEAYILQQEMGELDAEYENGFIYKTLQTSVNFAINEVEHSRSKIDDWKWIYQFRSVGHGLLGSIQAATSSDFSTSLDHFDFTGEKKNDTSKLRKDVIIGLAFCQGHKMAEMKLKSYVNRIDSHSDGKIDVKQILQQVLGESREQRLKANEMIDNEVNQNEKEIILSCYCARILIRRLLDFTKRKAEDGMLGKIEARKYLSEMESRIKTIVSVALEQLDFSRWQPRNQDRELECVIEEQDDEYNEMSSENNT